MTSAKVITEALASLQAEQQKFKERMLEAKRAAQQREAESIKRNEALREKVHDLEQEVQDLKNKLEWSLQEEFIALTTLQGEFAAINQQAEEDEATARQKESEAKERELGLHVRLDSLKADMCDLGESISLTSESWHSITQTSVATTPTTPSDLAPSWRTMSPTDCPTTILPPESGLAVVIPTVDGLGPTTRGIDLPSPERKSPLLDEPDAQELLPDPAEMTDAQRLKFILGLKSRPKEVGETWYLVSRRWFSHWELACQNIVPAGSIGAVENADLLDQNGSVILGLQEGDDIECVPEEAWNYLLEWYGPCHVPFPRTLYPGPFVDIYPIKVKVLTVASPTSTLPAPYAIPAISISTSCSVQQLFDIAVASVAPTGIPDLRRFWRVPKDSQYTGWSVKQLLYDYRYGQLCGFTLLGRGVSLKEASWQDGDTLLLDAKCGNGWASKA